MDNEIWEPVILNGEKSIYEVSNTGKIRNRLTNNIRKPCIDKDGYLRVHLYGKNYFIHRLVLSAFVSNLDNLPQVNHINGIKTDNRVENLEWCTAKYNNEHAWKLGLKKKVYGYPGLKGEDNPKHKYSNEDIVRVCELLQTGKFNDTEISNITGVKRIVVNEIKRRTAWTHISKDYNFDNVPIRLNKYKKFWNSIDRAIISGKKRKKIVKTLMEQGISENKAIALYRYRKDKIKAGKSLVQYTIYIDDGVELF